MYVTDIRLHFKISEVYQGLAEGEGIMSTDEKDLIMEFQVKDSMFGVIKSNLKVLRIPIAMISGATYRRNIFRSKLSFSVNDLNLLSKFPASKNGRISVSIKRHNKELAIAMVNFLQGHYSDPALSGKADGYDPFLGS